MENFYIVTFKNTHEAINAENEADKNNIKVTVIPTPTHITKSCGISLKIEDLNFKFFKELIDENKLGFNSIYYNQNQEYILIRQFEDK